MDSNYGEPAKTGYGTVIGQPGQQQPQMYAVPIQGTPHAGGVAPAGTAMWQAQACWMMTYLVISILGTIASFFMFFWMIIGMILGVIAGSFHACSCCTPCFGNNKKTGARCIQILSLVAGLLSLSLAIWAFVWAGTFDVSKLEGNQYYEQVKDSLQGLFIGGGLIGLGHAILSFITTFKFGKVYGSFDPVSTGQVVV